MFWRGQMRLYRNGLEFVSSFVTCTATRVSFQNCDYGCVCCLFTSAQPWAMPSQHASTIICHGCVHTAEVDWLEFAVPATVWCSNIGTQQMVCAYRSIRSYSENGSVYRSKSVWGGNSQRNSSSTLFDSQHPDSGMPAHQPTRCSQSMTWSICCVKAD